MASLLELQFPPLENGDEDPVLQTLPGCDESILPEKNLSARQETQICFLGQEDPLEEEMATHCSILAWRIPWIEETGGLQSMGSQGSDTTEQ